MTARLLILLIRIYQLTLSKLIRALFGPVCRFQPSCSAYAQQCLHLHGAVRGSLLSLKRVSKCHPFHPGGYDPPPPQIKTSAATSSPLTRTSGPPSQSADTQPRVASSKRSKP